MLPDRDEIVAEWVVLSAFVRLIGTATDHRKESQTGMSVLQVKKEAV